MPHRCLFAINRVLHFFVVLLRWNAKTFEPCLGSQASLEVVLHGRQWHIIMWTLWSGHTGHHRRQVQFHVMRVHNLFLSSSEQLNRSSIFFNSLHVRLGAVGATQILNSLLINREVADGGSVLGCHIGQSSTIR